MDNDFTLSTRAFTFVFTMLQNMLDFLVWSKAASCALLIICSGILRSDFSVLLRNMPSQGNFDNSIYSKLLHMKYLANNDCGFSF